MPWPNAPLTPLNPQSTENHTHTDRYLVYNSNHPISAKLYVIHTLIHRAKQVYSTPEFLAKGMDHLHKVLQDNDCPTQFFQQDKLQQKMNKKPNPSTGKFIEGVRFVVPYIKGLSKQYRHTLAKYKEFSLKTWHQHHQIFTLASKRPNSRHSENWYNLPLEMPNQQLHTWIHRWK